MKRLKILFWLLVTVISARGSIIYFRGPAFEIPAPPAVQSFDLNNRSGANFLFWTDTQTNFVLPPRNPVSGYIDWSYYIGTEGQSEVMVPSIGVTPGEANPPVQLAMFGTLIGNQHPPGNLPPQQWGVDAFLAQRCTSFGYGVICFPSWVAPLGHSGIGYIGIRFHARDGWHYGWFRARLPIPGNVGADGLAETAPVIVDWAYESRPGVPIAAGLIGPRGRSTQFVLQFANQPPSGPVPLAPGYGSFILTGQTLRYELKLLSPPPAELRNINHFHNEQVALLEQPFDMVLPPTYFGKVRLSYSQMAQLLRGDFVIADGNGTVVGRIVPVRGAWQRPASGWR